MALSSPFNPTIPSKDRLDEATSSVYCESFAQEGKECTESQNKVTPVKGIVKGFKAIINSNIFKSKKKPDERGSLQSLAKMRIRMQLLKDEAGMLQDMIDYAAEQLG